MRPKMRAYHLFDKINNLCYTGFSITISLIKTNFPNIHRFAGRYLHLFFESLYWVYFIQLQFAGCTYKIGEVVIRQKFALNLQYFWRKKVLNGNWIRCFLSTLLSWCFFLNFDPNSNIRRHSSGINFNIIMLNVH